MIISKFGSSDTQSLFSSLVNDIFDYVMSQDLVNMAPGRYGIKHLSEDEAYFLIQEYDTVENSGCGPEFHRKFTDVQFLVYGEEKVGWDMMSDQEYVAINQTARFNVHNDIGFVSNPSLELNYNIMKPGSFYVFTPRTLYIPKLAVSVPSHVKKVVIKIETSLLSDSYSLQPLEAQFNDGLSWRLN